MFQIIPETRDVVSRGQSLEQVAGKDVHQRVGLFFIEAVLAKSFGGFQGIECNGRHGTFGGADSANELSD